jgi:hypothetical protein
MADSTTDPKVADPETKLEEPLHAEEKQETSTSKPAATSVSFEFSSFGDISRRLQMGCKLMMIDLD